MYACPRVSVYVRFCVFRKFFFRLSYFFSFALVSLIITYSVRLRLTLTFRFLFFSLLKGIQSTYSGTVSLECHTVCLSIPSRLRFFFSFSYICFFFSYIPYFNHSTSFPLLNVIGCDNHLAVSPSFCKKEALASHAFPIGVLGAFLDGLLLIKLG